jgi:anti-anti-sigma factor
MMNSIEIQIERGKTCPEIGIVHLKGEMNAESIQSINHVFHSQCDDFNFVIAELSQISYISSSALGELMGCRTHLIEKGGDLALAGLSLKLRERLTAMDANKIFRFYPDVRSCINAYKWDFRGHSDAIELSFPSRMHFVPPIRQLVSRIARQKGFSDRDSFRIETIVDEICNNAVEHGLHGTNNCIDLSVKISLKKIEIKVINESDPEKVKILKEIGKSLTHPHIVDSAKRGRGLSLVKMLSNNFDIACSGAGTSVRVTKIREE